MPGPTALFAFTALSFALIIVPGPSVMFIVGRGVAYGRRAALATVAGNTIGVFIQVLLVAAGLGAAVERSAAAFTTIKVVGAAYLLWLGINAIRTRHNDSGVAVESGPVRSTRTLVLDGCIVGVTNPKAIVFLAAFLPQFAIPDGAALSVQMLVLGLIFAAIALVCDSGWAVVAGTAREWFAQSPRRLGRMQAGSGVIMLGLGARLAFTSAND